jgi:hypothetical protein
MLLTEQQLRLLIKKKLILEADDADEINDEGEGLQLDDIIDDFSDDFSDAAMDDNSVKAIQAVRKNNIILELILLMLEKRSEDFKNFYKNCKIDVAKMNAKIQQQERQRDIDKKRITNFITTFINSLKSANNAETFTNALETLKNKLNDYYPKWWPLQWVFFNISKGIDKINEFALDDNNFKTVEQHKLIQIPKNDIIKTGLLPSLIEKINQSRLTEAEKLQLIGGLVGSKDFSNKIRQGNPFGVTDVFDNVYDAFFPHGSSFRMSGELSKNISDLIGNIDEDFNITEIVKTIWNGLSDTDNEGVDRKKLLDLFNKPKVKAFLNGLSKEPDNMTREQFDNTLNEFLKEISVLKKKKLEVILNKENYLLSIYYVDKNGKSCQNVIQTV